MKQFTAIFLLTLFSVLFTACGGGSSGGNATGDTSNNGSEGSTGSNSFPNVDTSKPLTEQFQQIFSNMKPNSAFYEVKIKSVTRPQKFVGTWSMWKNTKSIKVTYNQDGSCEEEHLEYSPISEPKRITFDCRQWFHITLEDNNTSFIFTVFNDQHEILRYEWNDNNNLYLHSYSNGGVLLATRTSANAIANYTDARPLFGTWYGTEYPNYSGRFYSYWTFEGDNKFTMHGVTIEDSTEVYNETGTWELNGSTLSVSVPALDATPPSEAYGTALALGAPEKMMSNFLTSTDRIRYSYSRVGEPIMVSGDPLIGKFQGSYGGYTNPFAFTFIIKKEADHYKLDMYLNDIVYRNIKATKNVHGFLSFNTPKGDIQLRPSVNGLHIHQGLKILSYGYPLNIRVNRVSQNIPTKPTSIVGKWMRWTDDEEPLPRNEFVFFDNGTFKFKNLYYVYGYGLRRTEGTYRIEGNNKIFFKAYCQKDNTYTSFNLNEEHLSLEKDLYNFSIRPSATYGRVPDGVPLSSFWSSLNNYEKDNKIKIIPHPSKKGKYVFAETKEYQWLDIDVGVNTYTFNPNGVARNTISVKIYDGGLDSASFTHSYHIEAGKDKKEEVVIFSGSKESQRMPLYNTRQSICNSINLELITK